MELGEDSALAGAALWPQAPRAVPGAQSRRTLTDTDGQPPATAPRSFRVAGVTHAGGPNDAEHAADRPEHPVHGGGHLPRPGHPPRQPGPGAATATAAVHPRRAPCALPGELA